MDKKPHDIRAYRGFKRSFKRACFKYVADYFHSHKGSGHVAFRETFIKEYIEKHRRSRICDETIIKALRVKANNIKSTFPDELKLIVPRLVHRRQNSDIGGLRGLYQLQMYFEKNPTERRKYFKDIASYYVILSDIQEIKHWARHCKSILNNEEREIFQCVPYDICRCIQRLKRIESQIRFKYEWFAVYYAMKHLLRPHCMRRFCEMINRLFPDSKHPCSLTAMDDYTFLLNNPPAEWNIVLIPPQSKATRKSVDNLLIFYEEMQELQVPFPDEHYLFYYNPR